MENNLKSTVTEFLQSQTKMILASGAGESINASLVFYKFNDDFSLNFITLSETQKVKNFTASPNVSFVVTSEELNQTVQAWGVVEQVNNIAEHQNLIIDLATVATGGAYPWPILDLMDRFEDREKLLFRLKINKVRFFHNPDGVLDTPTGKSSLIEEFDV